MPSSNYELSFHDVLVLSSREALAAFFAGLGYATNARLIQTPAAMGLTSDALRSAVSHIERLASHENGFFQVYLFEPKTVTMAHTQAIVRDFRNRPGDYFLQSQSSQQAGPER